MQVSMRRSILWMGLSQGGLFVIQFGGSVVIARLLTPYDMGVYALAAATVGLLMALRVFGLGTFLIRDTWPPGNTTSQPTTMSSMPPYRVENWPMLRVATSPPILATGLLCGE